MRDNRLKDKAKTARKAALNRRRKRRLCLLYTSDAADEGLGVDLGFVEIGLACMHTYVYTRTAAAAAPLVYVLVL